MGPADYAIEEIQTTMIVGVTEVKKDDFGKDVAQNMVQVETILPNRKRKTESMNDELPANEPITRFEIITDAEVWMFLQCTRG